MATVFVSHRGVDRAKANALADALVAAGHKVWFDEWEILPGTSIVGAMESGREVSAVVLLLLSLRGITTPWISREWMSALADQMNGRNVRVIPVKYGGGDLPALMADIKVADLDKDWKVGMAELLRAIGP
jgi:hypothetical protein